METYTKDEIKNILKKYTTTKHPSINSRKNKTTHNTNEDAYNLTMHMVLKENEPKLYNQLVIALGNDFKANELYNYMHNLSGYCTICGRPLIFKTLLTGYKTCMCDTYKICTNNDLYNYICKYWFQLACNPKIKLVEKIKNLFFDKFDFSNINTIEDLYLYLTEEEPQKCIICGNPTKFVSFKRKNYGLAYTMCCSKECIGKLRSQRQLGEKNTCHKISDETMKKMKQEASVRIKNKIKNGEFTPNITNSWCHSMIKIKFIQNDNLIEGKYRSSWEAMFQLMNPNLLYEKLRIPYFYDNKPHSYIVDFIDVDNKIVYEIKPTELLKNKRNRKKQLALKKWAEENNYNICIITEKYFIDNTFKISLLEYTSNEYKEKILHTIKTYYKNFNIDYEN